jgi:hypothetical protein
MQLENRWGFPGLVHVDLEREIPECVPKTVGAGGTIQLLGGLYLLAFGAVMLTSKEYVQQADRHEDNCEADVKWMNGYALRPYHKLSKAHQYPA